MFHNELLERSNYSLSNLINARIETSESTKIQLLLFSSPEKNKDPVFYLLPVQNLRSHDIRNFQGKEKPIVIRLGQFFFRENNFLMLDAQKSILIFMAQIS